MFSFVKPSAMMARHPPVPNLIMCILLLSVHYNFHAALRPGEERGQSIHGFGG